MNDLSIAQLEQELNATRQELAAALALLEQARHDASWNVRSAFALHADLSNDRRHYTGDGREDVAVVDIVDMRSLNKRFTTTGLDRLMHQLLTVREDERITVYRQHTRGDELVALAPAGALLRGLYAVMNRLAAHGVELRGVVTFNVRPDHDLIGSMAAAVDGLKTRQERGLWQWRPGAHTPCLPLDYLELIQQADAAGVISGDSMAALQHPALPVCAAHHQPTAVICNGVPMCAACYAEARA